MPFAYGLLGEDNSTAGHAIERGGRQIYDKSYDRNLFVLPYATIYTSIDDHQIRDIDDKKNTITLDISVTMTWMDGFISTAKANEIEISPTKSNEIWRPNFPIHNLYDYKAFMDSLRMVNLKILRTTHLDDKLCFDGPMVNYKIEAKVTFYCSLDFSSYPMDKSICKLRFGGQASNTKFTLRSSINKSQTAQMYRTHNFEVSVSIRRSTTPVGANDILLIRCLLALSLQHHHIP